MSLETIAKCLIKIYWFFFTKCLWYHWCQNLNLLFHIYFTLQLIAVKLAEDVKKQHPGAEVDSEGFRKLLEHIGTDVKISPEVRKHKKNWQCSYDVSQN